MRKPTIYIAASSTDDEVNLMERLLRAFSLNRGPSAAVDTVNRLVDEIWRFHMSLAEEHEVAIQITSFGQQLHMYIEHIEHAYPYLVVFHGKLESGDDVRFVQHVNAIGVLLLRANRREPDEPKRPIGFTTTHRHAR